VRNRLTITVLALFLAATATAQTQIRSGNVAGQAWQGAIADAFYTDGTMLTVRPHAEIMENWQNLSEANKTRVRRDCAAISAAPPAPAADAGGAAASDDAQRGGGAAVSIAGSRWVPEICAIVGSM
jgi:hypothetical protein